MEIKISNNYAGSICNVKFQKPKEWFGICVSIHGFIETNSLVVEHCKSHGKFVEEEFNFKIPTNVIPTYESKNFKIYYELDCFLLKKETKNYFKVPLILYNNNINEFFFDKTYAFEINLGDFQQFEQERKYVCSLLLNELENNPQSIIFEENKNERIEKQSIVDDKLSNEVIEVIAQDTGITKDEITHDNNKVDKVIEDSVKEQQELNDKFTEENPQIASNKNTTMYKNTKLSRFTNFEVDAFADNYISNNFRMFSKEFIDKINEITDSQRNDAEITKDILKNSFEQNQMENENVQKNLNQSLSNTNESFDNTRNDGFGTKCNFITQSCNESLISDDKAQLSSEPNEQSFSQSENSFAKEAASPTDSSNPITVLNEKFQELQKNITKPVFSNINIINISGKDNVYAVLQEEEEIAKIKIQEYFFSPGIIKFEYSKNIKNTSVQVWRHDYDKEKLIDAEMLFSLSFDSEFCIEKNIKCSFEGWSIKNPIFEVKFLLFISLDDSEVSLPLLAMCPYSMINIEN